MWNICAICSGNGVWIFTIISPSLQYHPQSIQSANVRGVRSLRAWTNDALFFLLSDDFIIFYWSSLVLSSHVTTRRKKHFQCSVENWCHLNHGQLMVILHAHTFWTVWSIVNLDNANPQVPVPVNTIHRTNSAFMLYQRRRRWANITSALCRVCLDMCIYDVQSDYKSNCSKCWIYTFKNV